MLVLLLLGGEAGTQQSDALTSQPMAHVNTGVELLALDDPGDETTGESVSSSVRVVDFFRVDGMDLVLLHRGFGAVDTGHGDDGGIGTLSDDHDSRTTGVLLREACKVLCDLGDVLGLSAIRQFSRDGSERR